MSKKLRLAGSGALLAFLGWRTDWRQIAGVFAGLHIGWWMLAVALYALTQSVSSVRWRLLARPLGFTQSSRQFLVFYYVGMFFNLVLPTSVGGDVVRAWYLNGGSGRKVPALLSVFADRASGLLMLIAIACVATVCYPFALPPLIPRIVYGVGTCAVVGLVVLIALARYADSVRQAPLAPVLRGEGLGRGVGVRGMDCIALRANTHTHTTPHPNPSPRSTGARGLMDRASVNRLGWRGHANRLLHFSRDVQGALFPGPRVVVITTLISLAVQSANVIVLWSVGQALGVSVPAAYYWILVPVISLLTMLPISLNGMGVREWGMVLLLAPLGVGQETATALSLLWFVTFSAVSVVGGGCYLFGRFPRFEVRPDDDSVRCDPDQGREGQHQAAA